MRFTLPSWNYVPPLLLISCGLTLFALGIDPPATLSTVLLLAGGVALLPRFREKEKQGIAPPPPPPAASPDG
jgi:hypothetical protein